MGQNPLSDARQRRRPRTAALTILLVQCVTLLVGARAVAAFEMQDVVAKAQALAKAAYQDPKGQVPEWLTKITYDQWRDIRFRPEYTLWRDEHWAFQVQFFHPGFYYNRTVAMNVVDAKGVHPVPFSPSRFDYGRNDFASKVPQNLGYAGFRVHAPIKQADYYDEVIVFLGASYFRAVGKNQVFGLSARGLAIDTAEPSGEEFPYFKEFWLVSPEPPAPGPTPKGGKKPASKAKATKEPTAPPDPPAKGMTIYALLDSPSLAGAYRFTVEPGEQTIVSVESRVFLRQAVQKLGIAPLTSMFFHGEDSPRQFEDFRPEVHDSDGLLLSFESGEWLWRPLDNPRTLQVSGLHMMKPRGFGLIQRDRDFEHYQDLETRAEQRPSAWVTPRGDWGAGRVEVVEIPTKSDTNDNIVAFWVPEKSAQAGETVAFAYVLSWYGDDPTRPPGGRVTATRRDRGTTEGAYRFVVDFAGKELDALPATMVLRGVVSASKDDGAEILDQQVVKNPATGGWRLTFQVRPKKLPVDLRAFLDKDGNALTETWSYVLLQ